MERIYINNFCEDLNYQRVVLYIGNVNYDNLKKALSECYVNKLWRLDNARFIYIENCDLQDLSYPITECIEEGYDVYILHEDEESGKFYVEEKLRSKREKLKTHVDELEGANYPIITLCGSTKFKDDFIEAQKRLTLQGYIVLSVGLFGHSGDDLEGTKEMLDDMHKRKIDLADEIFVINRGGYIGSSTQSEIAYAKEHNKKISYLEEVE
jgi:hypothetical protein